MKITTSHLQGMFNRFHHAIGSPDGLRLDYNPCYGGYKLTIVDPSNGCEDMPFLHCRMKKTEMYYALYMACLAIDFKTKDQSYQSFVNCRSGSNP